MKEATSHRGFASVRPPSRPSSYGRAWAARDTRCGWTEASTPAWCAAMLCAC